MANTDRICGMIPYKYDSNLIIPCYKAAATTVTNDMFVGDPVILAGSADSATGNPSVTVATAGDGNQIFGVVTQIAVQPANLDRAAWIDGASAGTVMVCIDPMAVYEMQADDALAVTDVGYNGNLVLTQSGSRTTGASGFEFDATVDTEATHQLKLVGFSNRADNEIGAANNKVLVMINARQTFTGAGSVAV